MKTVIDKILNNKELSNNMTKNANMVLQNNKGAILKTMNLIKKVLNR